MMQIFNGRGRGLGQEARDEVFLKVYVGLREHLHHFKGARLAVFIAIALHSNDKGWAWPSITTLQKETGYNPQTISEAITDLCSTVVNGERVLLSVQPRKRGSFGNNKYLIFPSAAEVIEFESSTEVRRPRKSNQEGETPAAQAAENQEPPAAPAAPESHDSPYTEKPYTEKPYTEKPSTENMGLRRTMDHEQEPNIKDDHAPDGASPVPYGTGAISVEQLVLRSIGKIKTHMSELSLDQMCELRTLEEAGKKRRGLLDLLDDEIARRNGTLIDPSGLVIDLRTALMLIRDTSRRIIGGRAAVVAELYRMKFGRQAELYPPNMARLRKMAKHVSGGAVYICSLIANTREDLEGDPHDYLYRLALQSAAKKAEYKEGDGHGTRYERPNGDAARAERTEGAGRGSDHIHEATGQGAGAQRELGRDSAGSAGSVSRPAAPGASGNPYQPRDLRWIEWQRAHDRQRDEALAAYRARQAAPEST